MNIPIPDKPFRIHAFTFETQDNTGESVTFTTEFYKNEDGEVYTHQKFELNSSFNIATLKMYSMHINSKMLRELANELEKVEEEVGDK